MRIESSRMGPVEVAGESLITFPSGLVGLPAKKRFVILEFGDGIPLGWMQCVDEGDFGLPVADPAIFTSNYSVEIPQKEIAELELARVDDAVMLIVTTVAAGGVMVTGNLRAPLVVNTANRVGRQVVLERPDLDFRTLVDPMAFARAAQDLNAAGSSLGQPAESPTERDGSSVAETASSRS